MNHTLKAIWGRIASLWKPGGLDEVEQQAEAALPEQRVSAPSAETMRQAGSVDVFVTNTARERERLEARLDRQLSLMTGGRFRGSDDEVERR